LLFFALALVIGVFADLARVHVARGVAKEEPLGLARRAWGGFFAALSARRKLGRATLAWGWRAGLGTLLLYAGAFASDIVGGRGGAALMGLFVFHQLVMLARSALRVSWLAKALRVVS
jgi:hypothetical protein